MRLGWGIGMARWLTKLRAEWDVRLAESMVEVLYGLAGWSQERDGE